MEDNLNDQLEQLRKRIEDYDEKGYDKTYEDDWKDILNSLNKIKLEVYARSIFSDNEEFKDIKTEDIKFLLISYYQSETVQKFPQNREQILAFALKFYSEFYSLLTKYDYLSKEKKDEYLIATKQEDDEEKTKQPSFQELSMQRDKKIQMYRYKKTLSEKLKKIEKEQSYDDNREYWVTYLELSYMKMLETIKQIKMEIDSLNYLKQQKKSGNVPMENENQQSKNSKFEYLEIKSPEDLWRIAPNNKLLQNVEIITTSNNPNCVECLQNLPLGISTIDQQVEKSLHVREEVFKPSNLPVLTLDEFADREKARMEEAQRKQEEANQNKEDEDSDKEEVSESKTKKAREWDDWKDLNPKGSGNTKKR